MACALAIAASGTTRRTARVRGSGTLETLRTSTRRAAPLIINDDTKRWTNADTASAVASRLSGIALPKFIVDTPGGFGKVPVGPEWVVHREPGITRFRTPRGVEVDYVDPPE